MVALPQLRRPSERSRLHSWLWLVVPPLPGVAIKGPPDQLLDNHEGISAMNSTSSAKAVPVTEDLLAAVHEAGHAVVFSVLGRPFTRVRLAGPHGHASIDFEPVGLLTGDDLEREVICALAGVIAEACIADGQAPVLTALGGLGDHAAVRQLLGPRARDKQLIERLQERALKIVESNINPIKRVAKALLKRDELSADEVAVAGAPFVVPT